MERNNSYLAENDYFCILPADGAMGDSPERAVTQRNT